MKRERPPGARLIGLSVVLDGRLAVAGMAAVTRLIARLGFDGVWWRQPPLAGDGPGVGDRPGTPDGPGAGNGSTGDTVFDTLAGAAGAIPLGLVLDLTASGTSARWLAAASAHGARLAVAGSVATGLTADTDAVLVAASAERDLDAEVARAVAASGGHPVLLELPVSIGRTEAEAQARTAGEILFEATGHPAQQGLFGTLEECQYRAAGLAHAGVTELLCHLPGSRDLPDVLAQLRAVAAVGGQVLRPGEPPSPAPPPPTGWGGRR